MIHGASTHRTAWSDHPLPVLKQWGDQMHPQLREYLKARSYTLLIGGIRGEWVDNFVDHGPIDRGILGSVMVVKGAESDDDLYRLAMEEAGVSVKDGENGMREN